MIGYIAAPLPYDSSDATSSVNPITTRGADYAHHITASPPGFENPAASLLKNILKLTVLSQYGHSQS